MVEGGISKTDKTQFAECWKTTWKTPYIMRLALSAGIGGFLFGYDTGVISGALLYIREDFPEVDRKTWLQETIVSMAVAGAIIGAAFGGWINDRFGRKLSILVADVLFFVGAIVMALSPAPWMIIVGRIFVGFGVGMASMTAPLYISEASPARIRGALVSTNGLLITGGQFLSYLINLAFTHAPGTWRWMLGVAGLPAVVQFFLMLSLPESPRWLYRQNKVEESRSILEKIYPADEVEDELTALRISVETEKADEHAIGDNLIQKVKGALSNVVVRRGLYAGVTVQVAQQFSGINTVMYYSPTIVQFAGFASNKTAMALSLITSGLNAIGSIASMTFVDRYGRRRMMIISMIGIITCLAALSIVFSQAASHSPKVDQFESMHFASNATCPSFVSAVNPASWNCLSCLKAECGFCANGVNEYSPGACLALTTDLKNSCRGQHRTWFKDGCPSRIGFLAVVLLGLYIISYSPGMGTVPWIVNSEIYPLRYRGIGGGMAAVSNWVSNLIVSETFLTLTKALGSSGTFLLFAAVCVIGLICIYWFVPETKGLQFEEVERMLKTGFKRKAFRKMSKGESEPA
ncbi:inositol transporter 4-like isoform X2 [Durio zibethinus]|uniref:Inositol transporter 4-like isoform X2 n=1 Tax=Durio zibethinus TaxID=66656 RepID=A0A6P5WEE0_DURZI|nr:inositol transporter 4-like isoform X2 [Durio zibethinus]